MDEISDVDAQCNFAALLDQVERGHELVITRGGRPIARLVAARDRSQAHEAAESLRALRASLRDRGGLLTLEEIIAFRDEGRR